MGEKGQRIKSKEEDGYLTERRALKQKSKVKVKAGTRRKEKRETITSHPVSKQEV